MTDAHLRPWRADDVGALLDAVRDPEVALQLGVTADDPGAVRAVLDARSALRGPRSYAFAIELDGIAVGELGMSSVEPRHRTARISYWLIPQARGRGLATRALASVAAWAFADLDLYRLALGHRVNNPVSGAVARRAGFVEEGIERARLEYDGVRHDVRTHARLRTDPAPVIELLPIVGTVVRSR